MSLNTPRHIRLTSHPEPQAHRWRLRWGAPDPATRGPVIGSVTRPSDRNVIGTHGGCLPPLPAPGGSRGPVIGSVTRPSDRNVIGTHGGSYSLYRALAVSSGTLSPLQRPDLANTHPVTAIGPHPQWIEPGKIVSLDPWGHLATEAFGDAIGEGIDIRPTIAVTKARLNLAELNAEIAAGRLTPDGVVLHRGGDVSVTKAAIDPVWWLPGIAERFAVKEHDLRRTLFEQTGGMYPELVTRPDLEVFLP